MTKQLIVVPPGMLSSHDKNRLSRAGFVWLEADNPDDVRVLVPELGMELPPGDLLRAAADAILASYDDAGTKFGHRVARAIVARDDQEASAE